MTSQTCFQKRFHENTKAYTGLTNPRRLPMPLIRFTRHRNSRSQAAWEERKQWITWVALLNDGFNRKALQPLWGHVYVHKLDLECFCLDIIHVDWLYNFTEIFQEWSCIRKQSIPGRFSPPTRPGSEAREIAAGCYFSYTKWGWVIPAKVSTSEVLHQVHYGIDCMRGPLRGIYMYVQHNVKPIAVSRVYLPRDTPPKCM